jgi:hypothetical protein
MNDEWCDCYGHVHQLLCKGNPPRLQRTSSVGFALHELYDTKRFDRSNHRVEAANQSPNPTSPTTIYKLRAVTWSLKGTTNNVVVSGSVLGESPSHLETKPYVPLCFSTSALGGRHVFLFSADRHRCVYSLLLCWVSRNLADANPNR